MLTPILTLFKSKLRFIGYYVKNKTQNLDRKVSASIHFKYGLQIYNEERRARLTRLLVNAWRRFKLSMVCGSLRLQYFFLKIDFNPVFNNKKLSMLKKYINKVCTELNFASNSANII
jgi:hypothetical protein